MYSTIILLYESKMIYFQDFFLKKKEKQSHFNFFKYKLGFNKIINLYFDPSNLTRLVLFKTQLG
jgi:hypothetical protein